MQSLTDIILNYFIIAQNAWMICVEYFWAHKEKSSNETRSIKSKYSRGLR